MKELPSMNEEVQINPVREILQNKRFFYTTCWGRVAHCHGSSDSHNHNGYSTSIVFYSCISSMMLVTVYRKPVHFFCFSYNFCSVQLYTDCV